MHRSLPVLCCALLWGCGAPTCPPPKVELPAERFTLPFTTALPVVAAKLNGSAFDVLLDTGFDRSAISSPDARIDLSAVRVELGEAKTGPSAFDILISPTGDNLLGNELLHQLPLVFDRAQRHIEVHPGFVRPVAGDIPLLFSPGQSCREGNADKGADGPFGMLVSADLEGTQVTLLLDTGSELTLIRTSLLDGLTNRPKLEGLRLATGFAGNVIATAVRARTLGVDVEQSPNALVVASPEVDRGLDDIAAELSKACGCERSVDGLLGQTFLREFRVDLRVGESATTRRSMRLSRADTQTHWKREFVGIGFYYSQTTAGLRIDAFLTPSPLRDAGALVNDVIVRINGMDAKSALAQLGTGTSVALTIDRGGQPVQLSVPVKDLLPDPGPG